MQRKAQLDGISSAAAVHRDAASWARWTLRSETMDLHLRAEELLGDRACDTLANYGGMLRSNLAVTEAVLRATSPFLTKDLRRGIAADALRLREDLGDIGVPVVCEDAHLDVDDPAAAIGAVYVLEGARLGGKVLARQAEARLGLSAESGAAYLNGDGRDSGRRWRRFLAALEERIVASEDIVRAVAAARETFRLVILQYEKV